MQLRDVAGEGARRGREPRGPEPGPADPVEDLHPMRRLTRLITVLAAAALLLGGFPALSGRSVAASSQPPAFGVQFHGMWSSYTDQQRALFLDQTKAAGATWVRIDVSWAMLQPTSRNSYDLNWGVPFVDRVVNMATSRGLRPLITLWLTPGWANGGAGERTLPTDPNDYARAAAWAAARWAGKVPAWEIWNEPNEPSYMTGTDPVAYTRLLQAAYPAIKAANPAATVVFGGPASNDSTWIARAYAAGARGSFDVMATHPYMAIADQPPTVPDDGTPYNFTHLASVYDLMVRNGDGGKPIWATEFGWSSHPNTGTEANWNRGVTEAQQGQYLVQALELARQTMPYVTNMFWYTDRDFPSSSIQNSNYGLFYNDLRPKPAYFAVKAYLQGFAPSPAATGAPAPTASAPAGAPAPTPGPSAPAPGSSAPTGTTPAPAPAAGPDLAARLTGPSSATLGSTSTYPASVQNLGTAPADSVVVEGTVPSGARLAGLRPDGSGWTCVLDQASFTCTWSGTLAPGAVTSRIGVSVVHEASGTFAVQVRVVPPAGQAPSANDTATVSTTTS